MWNKLNSELDQWQEAGTTATFWWRDDDAVEATSELDRLVEQINEAQAPLLMASIPLHANSTLVGVVNENENISVAQHGYAHVNHAPRGQGLGAWELGLHRGEQAVLNDLKQGFEMLFKLFGDRFIPVVVPPWNRIDSNLFSALSEFGYKGVSAFGPNETIKPESGMIQVNCHCDPVKWKGGPRFSGVEKSISMICQHLAQRRKSFTAVGEPTGLLTHHLDMDEQAWIFVSELANQIKQHPAAQWIHPKTIFRTEQ